MRHNFSSQISYDTAMVPVNREARRMLAKQPPFDLCDERAPDAMALAEILQGSGALARGVSTMEVASLIMQRMKKIEKATPIETTLAPDLMELKRDGLNLSRERFNQHKYETRLKHERFLIGVAESKEYNQVLKEMAKRVMPDEDYSELVSITIEERNRRLSAGESIKVDSSI